MTDNPQDGCYHQFGICNDPTHRRNHGELRLTLGDLCEAPLCPLDATQTVVDKKSKPWRVCDDHRKYFQHQPDEGRDIGSDIPGGGAA